MARNMDFIGFTFNGCHSSEFNIYSVSDGSRYQDVLVPNPIDYTEQVPGGVGQYYFGSDMDIREFPLSIAYDKLTEVQVRELRNWLAPDVVGELIFDERPYKTYAAKISSSPSLSFICFDTYNKETGKKERVYKGEGSISFICYYPLGVVSGDKKQLGWYREQIDDRVYRSIGGSSSIIEYKLGNNEIAIFEKIKGNTLEIGSGEKGPDNPYTLTGVQPTKVTACGWNLADAARVWVWGNPEFSVEKFPGGFYLQADTWVTRILAIPCSLKAGKTYVVSYRAENVGSVSVKTFMYLPRINQYLNGSGKPFVPNADTDTLGIYVGLEDVAEGVKIKISDVQVELSPAATPYEPYTGQTVSLPAIAPLWGTGDIRDEYDAATGVETRRWKRLVFDGTENWAASATGTAGKYRVSLSIADILPTATFSKVSSCRCSHYATISADNTYHLQIGISANYGTSHGIFIYDDAYDAQDMTDWKAYLAAQYAAGTPVTVVYQLAEPVITKKEEVLPFSNFLPSANSGLIINANPEYYNYFTDSNANISLRLYGAKYSNIDEWALSTGMAEDLDITGVNKGYDHYITLPDNSKGIQLFNPGDKETDFILSFNKPTPMNDILFTLSNGEQFMLNLRSSDTDVEDYGAVSDAEKRIAAMTGGVITIDTKKNRIMYKYGTGENVTEESIYFALKKGQFFKIPKNRTSTGGYNLVIGTTSNIETDSIKISYDYLYY